MEIVTALIGAGITVAVAHHEKIINFFKNRFTRKTLEEKKLDLAAKKIVIEKKQRLLEQAERKKKTQEVIRLGELVKKAYTIQIDENIQDKDTLLNRIL